MIPIQLVVEGIFSYKEKTIIDFTGLATSGLFGIFGNVGSGKSSILEAITFVLYGAVNRLNSKEKLSYNMMNLQTDQSFISFTFEYEEKKYIAEYKSTRGKNFEDIKSPTRKFYLIEGGIRIPLESAKAENIFNLTYDEFRKIIIIPQNEFTSFILMGETDRIKMLNSLFKLQDYDLHDATKSIWASYNNQFIACQERLMILQDVNENQIITLEEESTSLHSEWISIDQKIKSIQQFIQSQDVIADQFNSYQRILNLQQNLLVEKETIELLKIKIKNLQWLQVTYSPLYNSIIEIENKIEKLNVSLQQISFEIQLIDENISDNINQRNSLISEIGTLDYCKTQSNIIEQNITYWIHQKVLKDNQKKASILLEKLQNLNTQKTELENSIIEHRAAYNLLEKNINDNLIWNTIKYDWDKHHYLSEQLNILNNKYFNDNILAEKYSNIKSEKIYQWIKNEKIISQYLPLSISQLSHEIDKDIQLLQLELSTLDEKYQRLLSFKVLEELSGHLHEGHNCPLCGSTNHPSIYEAKEQQQEIINIEQQIKDRQTFIQQLHFLSIDLKNIINQFKNEKIDQNNILSQINNIKIQLESIKNQYPDWKKWDNEIVINKIQSLQGWQSELQKINQLIQTATNDLQKIDIHSIQQEINNINLEVAKAQSIIEHINLPTSEIIEHADIEALQSSLINYRNTYEKLELIESNITEKQKVIDTLNIERKLFDNQLLELINEINDKNKCLDAIISEAGIEKSIIPELLSEKYKLESYQVKVNDYDKFSYTYASQLEQLSISLNGLTFDDEKYQQSKIELQQLQEHSEAILIQKGQLQEQLLQLHKQLKDKLIVIKEYDQLENKLSDIKVFMDLFNAKGFVKYISKKYLKNLFGLANSRFRKFTMNQLELTLGDNDEFLIIDYLNNGQKRLIKTLSGGQLFLAALSLALALSEQIQLINKSKQQFFFIDEGFGSLDKQSLEIVIEALKQLRNEGRIVGIISHVEELQQEIEYYIKITKDPEKGSLIKNHF